MDNEDYHKYVFDEKTRSFKGEFEQMYIAEKTEGFDSWHQDDVSFLDKQLCLKLVEQSNFNTLADIGCGKGAFTHLMKTQDNSVIGLDISHEAVSIAGKRYKDIQFFAADIEHSDWANILNQKLTKGMNNVSVECVVCLETLSYVKTWEKNIQDFSELGKFALIKLFIPDDPIGYIKSRDKLIREFNKHFDVIEHIDFINRQIIIMFGKSKLIGEL